MLLSEEYDTGSDKGNGNILDHIFFSHEEEAEKKTSRLEEAEEQDEDQYDSDLRVLRTSLREHFSMANMWQVGTCVL